MASGPVGADEVGGFDAFFAAQREHAVRLAWLLTHDRALAEDVAQDAFAVVLGRFEQIDDPTAYLRRTIVNTALKRFRSQGREARRIRLWSAGAPDALTPEPSSELADVIAGLPDRQRAVVVLRYWADLDHRSIAEALGVRVGTVRSLLSRSLEQLRREVEP